MESTERIGCRMVGVITGSRNAASNEYGDNYAVHEDNWTLETWKLRSSRSTVSSRASRIPPA